MLVSADPIRVVVESAPTANWGIWGPLAGVIVGAILGALGQVVAGRLQHKRDVRREEVGVRRGLYVRTLAVVDELTSAVEVLAQGTAESAVAEVAGGEQEGLHTQYRKVEGVSGELGVSGDLQVLAQLNVLLERRDYVSEGLRSGEIAEELEQVREIRRHLMLRMREDLGTTTPQMREHL